MQRREVIEQSIRETLATETRAIALSQKLFHPDGLFARLCSNDEERRELAQSDLFREAQHRLSDLQREEGAAFAQVVEQAQRVSAGVSRILQLLDAEAG